MLAGAQQGGGDGQAALPLHRLDRHAGGDPAVQRYFQHVVGRLQDDGWRFLQRRRRALRNGGGDLGHAHHFERAGTVGEAADEIAFLERADQAMDTGLGLQVQRLLHLLERRGNAGFSQPVVNETEQFMLLAR